MPQATIYPKNSTKDLKGALSALCRLFMDDYGDDEVSKRKDLETVGRFIRRADRSAPAGGGADA